MTLVRTSQAVCNSPVSPCTQNDREIVDLFAAIAAAPGEGRTVYAIRPFAVASKSIDRRHVPGRVLTPLGTIGPAQFDASGYVRANDPFDQRVLDRIARARLRMSLGQRATSGVPRR